MELASPADKKARILILLTGLDRGGAETQAVLLASGLRSRGWLVRLVSLLPPKDLVDALTASDIPVASLGMRRGIPDPRAVWRLARILWKFRPVVLHAHMIHANLLARVVRLVAPIPVLVCTAHSTMEIGHSFRTEKATHLAYRFTDFLCDLTTHVSNEGCTRFLQGKATRPTKLRFVPNAVDTQRFAPDLHSRFHLRKQLAISEEAFVWLAVGRLEDEKEIGRAHV